MKIELKNNEFGLLINMINGYQAPTTICRGLRFENISMGVKVRLSKIEKQLVKHLLEYESIRKSIITEVFPEGISEELEKTLIANSDEKYLKLISEINEYDNDTVTIEFDPISLSKVEDVNTDFDYSFLLEKISE